MREIEIFGIENRHRQRIGAKQGRDGHQLRQALRAQARRAFSGRQGRARPGDGPVDLGAIMVPDTGLAMWLSRPSISLYNAGAMNDRSR
jgi:hypothetical protein